MNKKGFTLVELIAVIVLIAIISLLTFPALNNLRKNNNEKEFTTYEDMMVEYAKAIPNYQYKSFICLNDLGIKKINETMTCNGYVLVSGKSLIPYLYCKDANNVELYKTEGFTSKGCSDY